MDGGGAAVVGRPARRSLLPGVPQRHDTVHRPEARAGGPHRARRGRPRGQLHPAPGRVRARLHVRAGRAPRRPRGAARRESRAWAGSACSSTRPRGSSTPGGTVISRSSCRTSPTCPIAIYPEMKIGQISFLQMTTPAEHPYGSGAAGSKYQGQRGPDTEPLLPELPRSLRNPAAAAGIERQSLHGLRLHAAPTTRPRCSVAGWRRT